MSDAIVNSEVLKSHEIMRNLYSLSEKQIERKNALLRQALEALKSVEWEVNIGIIADIEKELEGSQE